MSLTLPSLAHVLEPFGAVQPTTLLGPVRQATVKYGNALFVEEGTTNLVTNPSAEVDTTGWTVGTGNAVITRDTTRARHGVASFKVTVTASGDVNINIVSAAFAAGNVAAGVDIYPRRLATIDLSAGAVIVRTSNVPSGRWTRVLAETAAGAAGSGTTVIYNGAVAGEVFWLDAGQVEQKRFATTFADGSLGSGYAWTGTAHASTSVRTAGQLKQPLAAALSMNAVTVCQWIRVGRVPAVPVFVRMGASDEEALEVIGIAGNVQLRKIVGGTDTAVSPGVTLVSGDLLFCAVTFNGSTLIGYASKNGGAILSASAASTTVPASATTVAIGSTLGGTNHANSAVEQVLVYNAALTAAEISVLAFTEAPTDFDSDARIVFASGTPGTDDSVTATTTAGTGRYRSRRTIDTRLEDTTPNGANPDDDISEYRATTTAGSGVGQGDRIAYDPTGTSGVYLIDRVFSPGGAFDELHLSRTA